MEEWNDGMRMVRMGEWWQVNYFSTVGAYL